MSDYHIDPSHGIADSLNPLLDAIAGMDAQDSLMFEQGCSTIVTLVNDALTEHYGNLLNMYRTLGIAEEIAIAQISTVFEPVVDLIEERVSCVQEAVWEAQEAAAKDGLNDLLAGLLGSMLGEEAAAEFLAEVEGEEAQAEYEAEVEAGMTEAQDFEDWIASLGIDFGSVA